MNETNFTIRVCAIAIAQPTSVDYSSSDYVKEEPIKLSIRGLRRTFYPPNQHVVIDNSPPEKKLKLQWVHGYRGRDTHKNLWVLPSGEMLYYVAAVAVLYGMNS